MDFTSYLERWAWVGLTLLVFALLSPSAMLVGLAMWMWLHWKRQERGAGSSRALLLLGSWAGLVLLWGTLAAQIVALRDAITRDTEEGTLLARTLLAWGEGTLLGPTIAGIVQLFRPQRPIRPAPAQQPAQPTLPAQPTQTQLSGVARRLTLPSPAVRPDQPPDASEQDCCSVGRSPVVTAPRPASAAGQLSPTGRAPATLNRRCSMRWARWIASFLRE